MTDRLATPPAFARPVHQVAENAVPGAVPRYEVAGWRERHRVMAGITGRGSGAEPFDLGLWSATPVGKTMDRWRALRASLGEFSSLVLGMQIHGVRIGWHDTPSGWLLEEALDGHATDRPGLLLAVTVADCVPVYLVDPVQRRIALLHAGWRGTAGRILEGGIGLLQARGSRPEDLHLHLGVSICGACYEVGADVFAACGVQGSGNGRLDLRAVLAEQAAGLGVRHISTSSSCTAHDPGRFFSHRASRGADGRMVAYLGLLP